MDDIDDLLDEVEAKFCGGKPAILTTVTKKPQQPTTPSTHSAKQDSLEDIINDIIADDGLDDVLQKNAAQSSTVTSNKTHSNESKVKCYTVYVAGSNNVYGSSTIAQQSVCDQLHCTSCDNKIVAFDNYKWYDSQCDYLVFRNNYPDFVRLKNNLMPREGYRAYCCQCSWLSAKGVLDLKTFKPEFKWVCRKH